MNQLGLQIKRLRETNLLSRKDLAQILQCSVSHTINIEKGVSGLSDDKKELLINHFELSPLHFNTDDDPVAPPEFDQQIGQNIKDLRLSMNLTQQEFAEEVGYSGSAAISALESGKRSASKKKLIEISEFFGVHVAELLRIKPETSRQEQKMNKLVADFYFLLDADPKPKQYYEIVSLISEACDELRRQHD